MNPSSRRAPHNTHWLPAVAAAALVGTVVVAGVAGGSNDGGGGASTSSTESSVAGSVDTVLATQPVAVETVATTAPVQKTPLDRTLGPGVFGEDVKRVQQRLIELGFAPGPVDGHFGELTTMAVWAFEKLVMQTPRSEATGRVSPELWERMQDPIVIRPLRPDADTPNHTEIYLPQQVLAVFHGDVPVFIAHISSGDNREWCEEVTISPGEYGNENGTEPLKRGECGLSVTPGGVYQYHRRVEGRRESALGGLLNPVYFNYGIAVHGAYNVPLQPASHGCVRIANSLSETFYGLVDLGDLVYVFDGVKEPEEYGQVTPRFNWPDPNYTTTTTSTSTTSTTTTTTVPASTEVPTTTAAPPTTAVVETTTPPVTTTSLVP